MRRVLALTVCFGLVSGCLVWAAQKTPKKIDLSGTWALDKRKVDQAAGGGQRGAGPMGRGGGRRGGGRGENLPGSEPLSFSHLVISQTENELKITYQVDDRESGEQDFVQIFKLGGDESVNPGAPAGGELKSRTSWNKDKLLTLGTIQPSGSDDSARRDVVFKQEFSISKDGKTLTLKTSRTGSRGQISTTETFVRKPDASK